MSHNKNNNNNNVQLKISNDFLKGCSHRYYWFTSHLFRIIKHMKRDKFSLISLAPPWEKPVSTSLSPLTATYNSLCCCWRSRDGVVGGGGWRGSIVYICSETNKTFWPPDPSDTPPCAPRSVLWRYSSYGGGVICYVEPRACRPNPLRCTCAARIPCGIPSPPRPIRPPNRCCSRHIFETGTYSGPSIWPKWRTRCSVRTGSLPIPVTSRSATNTIPIFSFGSFPRR